MSENVRQTKVDAHYGYLRKFWSLKAVSLTVKCKSTEGKKAGISTDNFRNHFRSWLYQVPMNFQDVLEQLEDETKQEASEKGYSYLIDFEDTKRVLELTDSVSIRIRSYEKDFFHMKCMKLALKPPIVLRALLRLSKDKILKEIFTAPEFLFAMIHLTESEPVLRKNIRWSIG
jgi:hypothetical protein